MNVIPLFKNNDSVTYMLNPKDYTTNHKDVLYLMKKDILTNRISSHYVKSISFDDTRDMCNGKSLP